MGSSRSPRSGGLWAFATEFYARPGLQAAFLRLQDEGGLDVPLLIALLHAGRHGSLLDGAALADLIAAAHSWRIRAIGPLRQVRKSLKQPLDGIPDRKREKLRDQVKTAELAAERLLLEQLEALLPSAGGSEPNQTIRTNLGLYLASLGLTLDTACEADLAQLALEAAIPL